MIIFHWAAVVLNTNSYVHNGNVLKLPSNIFAWPEKLCPYRQSAVLNINVHEYTIRNTLERRSHLTPSVKHGRIRRLPLH